MPVLSVLIPTKNRQDTAIEAIQTAIYAGDAHDVEVVVQDCSDDDALREILENKGIMNRVVYNYTDQALPMTANWNMGMSLVRGDYITVIGDDDAVLPDILKIVKWAEINNISAIKTTNHSNYYHPNIKNNRLAGKLLFNKISSTLTSVQDTSELLPIVSSTGDNYPLLPMVYHNIVKKEVLEHIRSISGCYFKGLSPDIYSAYAIAAVIPSFVMIDRPVTLIGFSRKSNTIRTKIGESHMHINEYEHFDYSWMVPDSWGLYSSNADNVAKAFTSVNRCDLLQYIDIEKVFARTIVAEPGRLLEHFKKFAIAKKRRMDDLRPLRVSKLLIYIAGKICLNLYRKCLPSSPSVETQEEISCSDILTAVKICYEKCTQEYLRVSQSGR